MAALEWASTATDITKSRQTESEKFCKEKEEGAKLAQWLIDCQDDETGKNGDRLKRLEYKYGILS